MCRQAGRSTHNPLPLGCHGFRRLFGISRQAGCTLLNVFRQILELPACIGAGVRGDQDSCGDPDKDAGGKCQRTH